MVELKRLELQDRECEQEANVKLRELELREKELLLQLKLKELESATATPPTCAPTGPAAPFDISKHIRFVPPFQEKEVDKYLLHFKKVVASYKTNRHTQNLPETRKHFLIDGALLRKWLRILRNYASLSYWRNLRAACLVI